MVAAEAIPQPTAPLAWKQGQLIGKGAFGNVFKGLVHATGQEVAVKQVPLPRDAGKVSDQIRSLESEVAVLRTLHHENIVRYLGTERTEEYLNIFLEFVPGGSIANKLQTWGPLREDTIRVYTKQILHGLDYLHRQKIMHRDIKGANILVDNHGVIKLADFGASKKIEDLATIGGSRSIRGTPNYMAPEVIRQLGHGRAADIWSLGCVVIEMATGRPPWADKRDPFTVMYHIASTKDLPTMPEALSPPAREFLTQCFNRVPRERPTAQQLLSHPWMRDVQVPRAPPTPAHLPQLAAGLQQQQAPAAEQGLQTPHNHHLPGPGVHSPPSPILEEPAHDSPARLAVPVPPAPRPSAVQPPAIRAPQVPGPENQVDTLVSPPPALPAALPPAPAPAVAVAAPPPAPPLAVPAAEEDALLLDAANAYPTLDMDNPMVEPTWLPHMPGNLAIAQRLAAVQEQEPSAPASPEGSAGAAAPVQELPSRSSSSGDERDARTTGRMSASGAVAPTVDMLPAFPSASTPGGPATAPDVSTGDRTPSPFNTAKAARARAQRPGLADIFVSACDQESGTTDSPGTAAFSPALSGQPSGGPLTSASRLGLGAPGSAASRQRVSASRRALEEAGILLDSTADPARLKQWRDELAAELDQQRRALTQQTSQRESVAVGMVGASVAVPGGGSVRPSVADL